jgi:uncharacterized circularly permuted ATP-grasp superfamily protein
VTLCSAPGAGVADDKAIYCYVPEMIRFYLGEEPILQNVPTWQCARPDECAHVLAHLDDLVVKEVHGSGGYGMLIGPRSTAEERPPIAERIRARPGRLHRPADAGSVHRPTLAGSGLGGRHVDFRPFCLVGRRSAWCPGA